MMRPAYISASGQFLPGEPVGNDRMADHIGVISQDGLRMGRLFLRRNRIRTRHYAMRTDGTTEWTLAKLGARAVENCLDRGGLDKKALTYLASATTQNDLMVPDSRAASRPRRESRRSKSPACKASARVR